MSDHDAPPIYEYNDEVINDEFFLDESNMLHELSMDDEDLLDVNGDSKTKHVGYFYLSIHFESLVGNIILKISKEVDDAIDTFKSRNGHKDFVSCLDFNYDGQFLASGCFHGIVQVWDASRNLKNVFEGLGGGIEGM
ncbi:hypothetical protein JHK85_025357 [Glycine max]|nr:hypothetical protein JHK85_025357 [Glycine max]